MSGTGRGAITADGCPVEVYLHFPHQGEADLIHAAVPAGATVLDLGCGTGRIAHPLIELGHPVTAVDASPAMLAHVRGAEVVLSTIADLDLGRGFDVVLMASHLVNTPDGGERHAMLAAAARHLAADGQLIAELYPSSWFADVTDRAGGHIGEVGADLTDVRRAGEVVTATIRYRLGAEVWTQTFAARHLDESTLRAVLERAGLVFGRWLRADGSWFVARRADPRPASG